MRDSASPDLIANLFRSLYRIRRVEEEIVRVYPSDRIKSPIHLSIGQESIAVGVCAALEAHDVVFSTYRGHAVYLAKGGSVNRMIAELYGKVDGCAKGKGGSMHLVDTACGMMGTSAVVASTIPNAIGYAYALKYQHKNAVAVSFFGDGATEEGVFYESLNFAALHQLPVVFVCENNLYAIHTSQKKRQAITNICDRVRPFGVPAERIEDGDVLAIHARMSAALSDIRSRESGPVFFECMTYRWKEHVGPNDDFALGYRTVEEMQPWVTNDQVSKLAARMLTDERVVIEQQVENEIKAAFAFAEQSPFPPMTDLHSHLYAGH